MTVAEIAVKLAAQPDWAEEDGRPCSTACRPCSTSNPLTTFLTTRTKGVDRERENHFPDRRRGSGRR